MNCPLMKNGGSKMGVTDYYGGDLRQQRAIEAPEQHMCDLRDSRLDHSRLLHHHHHHHHHWPIPRCTHNHGDSRQTK